MRKTLLLIAILVFAVVKFPAQTQNWAPVSWERYKVTDAKVSILLPKLPTKTISLDLCDMLEKTAYYAYAEGTVYELRIYERKGRGPRPSWCLGKLQALTEATFQARLNEVRAAAKEAVETSFASGGLAGAKFTRPSYTHVLLSDIAANKRWFELTATHRPGRASEADRYVNSLEFSASGKDVGEGSPWTLGDPMPANASVPASGDKKTIVPVTLIAKPKATYTDEARSSNVQGAVRLMITLQSNGAVGEITTLKKLESGLTEKAIGAARRLVFLPKLENGIPVDASMQIEYTFTIY